MFGNNPPSGGSGAIGDFLLRYRDEFWLLFRVIFAVLVLLHGTQKAFLLWGFPAETPLGALLYIAGWVEIVAGLLIGLGLLTRLGAGAIVVTMIVAYFRVHASGPAWPWPHLYPDPGGFAAHGGEVPILWFAIAGVIGVLGGGKYAVDRWIFKREVL